MAQAIEVSKAAPTMTTRESVDALRTEIDELRALGHSWTQISAFFSAEGVKVAPATARDYMGQQHPRKRAQRKGRSRTSRRRIATAGDTSRKEAVAPSTGGPRTTDFHVPRMKRCK